jgi:GNAT superfamily N-acetyltransferase
MTTANLAEFVKLYNPKICLTLIFWQAKSPKILNRNLRVKMEIIIRSAVEAEEADYPQIVDLFREFAEFEKLPERMTNSVDRMIKEKEFFNCFVAVTTDDRIIGYATYFFCYYTWTGKSLYMDDLYVQQEYRANGIGTKLINRVIEFAKDSKCHKLRWQVSNWNKPAIDFYKSIGAVFDNIERNCDLMLD